MNILFDQTAVKTEEPKKIVKSTAKLKETPEAKSQRLTAAVEARWHHYRETLEDDQLMWESLPLVDGYRLLAELRLSSERGAVILRDRESMEQGKYVTCHMASHGVSGCRGTFERGEEKFKQDRILPGQNGRVLSTYICSERCYASWRKELQNNQGKEIDLTRTEITKD